MNIVITMAGLGSRFRKAGFKVPKYMIEVNGKTLFEWSMMSLLNYNKSENVQYIFITMKQNNSSDFIKEQMSKLGVKKVSIVELDELTDGQATSAFLAKKYWKEDDELVIYNIDTYVEPEALLLSDVCGDGFIPCFDAPGEHWSFVKLDDDTKAVEVREKDRISDHCTIGLYYFKTCKLYEQLYLEYYSDDKNLEKGEKYIAPLYNEMISRGMTVKIVDVPSKKVHVLGTPEEVKAWANNSLKVW